MNPIQSLLSWLKATLDADPWYAEHGVAVLIENQLDILSEVERAVLSGTGCALILRAPRAENNRPALNVSVELLALENPTLNRCRPQAATALDAAWHAALALDGPNLMLRTVEHAPQDGLFQATATFDTLVTRERAPNVGGLEA